VHSLLNIDQIVSDFAPQKADSGNNILSDILKVVAPGFALSDKVVKQKEVNPSPLAGKQADFLGFIGSAISLAAAEIALSVAQSSSTQLTIATLKPKLENQLAKIFTATNDNIAKLNSKLFGGNDDIDLNQIVSFRARLGTLLTTDSSPSPKFSPLEPF
jgi:hypothetical protein